MALLPPLAGGYPIMEPGGFTGHPSVDPSQLQPAPGLGYNTGLVGAQPMGPSQGGIPENPGGLGQPPPGWNGGTVPPGLQNNPTFGTGGLPGPWGQSDWSRGAGASPDGSSSQMPPQQGQPSFGGSSQVLMQGPDGQLHITSAQMVPFLSAMGHSVQSWL